MRQLHMDVLRKLQELLTPYCMHFGIELSLDLTISPGSLLKNRQRGTIKGQRIVCKISSSVTKIRISFNLLFRVKCRRMVSLGQELNYVTTRTMG